MHLAQRSAAILACLVTAAASQAAVIGDSWDFGNTTGKDDLTGFTTSDPASRFSLTADHLRFEGITHATNSRRSGAAGVQITDLSSAPMFELQASGNPFVGTATANEFTDWEIHFLGSAAGTSNHGTGATDGVNFDGLVLQVVHSDTTGTRLALINRNTSPSSETELSSASWSLGAGAIDFEVTGTWIGSNLQLTATATNASNQTETLSHTLTSFTPKGNWIGLGAYTRGPQIHTFDTLAVVPEPGSLALLTAGGLLMLRRRRRT